MSMCPCQFFMSPLSSYSPLWVSLLSFPCDSRCQTKTQQTLALCGALCGVIIAFHGFKLMISNHICHDLSLKYHTSITCCSFGETSNISIKLRIFFSVPASPWSLVMSVPSAASHQIIRADTWESSLTLVFSSLPLTLVFSDIIRKFYLCPFPSTPTPLSWFTPIACL